MGKKKDIEVHQQSEKEYSVNVAWCQFVDGKGN